MKIKLTGEEAIAYGAVEAGVNLVTGYPGSPSSGTFEALLNFSESDNLDIEWSSNERVALEVAIGASIAGKRALVCVKSVGMNVMLDTLMALNLTPVNGGLVILLGDDPGGYASQNDQDTRPLAPMLEMPMMEPASASEAREMVREAFSLSESEHTAVIIRITRSFAQTWEDDMPSLVRTPAPGQSFVNEVYRFVPVPNNVVKKHRDLHKTVSRLQSWSEQSVFNASVGTGKTGIIAAGFAFSKLMDAGGDNLPNATRLFKLSTVFPLPKKELVIFLGGVRKVLILEESEPFVETQVRALAQQRRLAVRIHGSHDGIIGSTGELFRWQIQDALSRFLPAFEGSQSFLAENEASEWPTKKGNCNNCRYDDLLDLLERSCKINSLTPLFVADPGCFVTVAERLTAKYSIGSAVAVADGMVRFGVPGLPIALVGDSGFFHSSIPAICNAVHHGRDLFIVLVDNGAAMASGGQPHPGIEIDALGRPATGLNVEAIARGCGVDHVQGISIDHPAESRDAIISEALLKTGVRLLIINIS